MSIMMKHIFTSIMETLFLFLKDQEDKLELCYQLIVS